MTVHEVVVDPTQMFMVMELVDFDLGLLIEHMKQPFSEGQVKCLAMQLLSALAAVHESFVLHRDLKQTNLLLDKNGVLKLCDFGLARRAGSGRACTPNVTSLWYRAPEILLGEKVALSTRTRAGRKPSNAPASHPLEVGSRRSQAYGSAVDMWSFGCILAEWLQLGEPLMQALEASRTFLPPGDALRIPRSFSNLLTRASRGCRAPANSTRSTRSSGCSALRATTRGPPSARCPACRPPCCPLWRSTPSPSVRPPLCVPLSLFAPPPLLRL